MIHHFTVARRVVFALILTLLSALCIPTGAEAQSRQAKDSFIVGHTDYAVSHPNFVRDIRSTGITAESFKAIDKLNNPDQFIQFLEIWKKHFPEKSNFYAMYPKSWYAKLSNEQKSRLKSLKVKRVRYNDNVDFLALTEDEQIATDEDNSAYDEDKQKEESKESTKGGNSDLRKWCNSSNYKESWWIGQRHANYGMKLDGNVEYQYLVNPDVKSNETRIYDGQFHFWKNEPTGMHSLEGHFLSDKQIGRWEAKLDSYDIEVTFNDQGEMEGEFRIFKDKCTRDQKLVYSGSISNGYVTRLNFDGNFYGRSYARPIKISGGRYGSGNGHPAGRWLIKVGGTTDYRSNDKFFSFVPNGEYVVQFAKYADGYKLDDTWGEKDNWVKAECTKVTIIDEATGKRIDAGETITDIPRQLSDEVVDILNKLILRKSKPLKYSYMK